MTPPQLVGSSALCEVYWHVVLPGDRHVVNSSDLLSPVDPAQWLEVLLGRAAAKSQTELEDWAGATHLPGPAETQNAYLYSGLAPVSIEMVDGAALAVGARRVGRSAVIAEHCLDLFAGGSATRGSRS